MKRKTGFDIVKGSNGTYKIKQERIAKGGNGELYEVVEINDAKPEFDLVIKKLQDRYCKTNTRIQRFKNEIIIQEFLYDKVDSILPIVDKDIDFKWYIMPKAVPYKDICKELSFEQKIIDMLRLALDLNAIHSHNIYHRDIKPGNLLYYNNKLYICDFGIAYKDNGDNLTKTNEHIGPSVILPPELFVKTKRF